MQTDRKDEALHNRAMDYVWENSQTQKLKAAGKSFFKELKKTDNVATAIQKFNTRLEPLENKSKPKLLNPYKISVAIEKNIYQFLNDADLTKLATTNRTMKVRALSDARFKKRLSDPIRRHIQEKRMFKAWCDGIPLTRALIEENINAEVENVFKSLKEQGITNYQTLYSCYKKLHYFGIWALGLDQLILLSGNNEAINNWFGKNMTWVQSNEPLDSNGARILHYLALSGNAEAMDRYREINFDTVNMDLSRKNRTIAEYAFFSGNPHAVFSATTTAKSFENWYKAYWGVLHALFENALLSGDLRIIKWCVDHFPSHESVMDYRFIAKSGNIETFNTLTEQLRHYPGWEQKHYANYFAQSGNSLALKEAVLTLGNYPELPLYSVANKSTLQVCLNDLHCDLAAAAGSYHHVDYISAVQHCAAKTGDPETLLACANEFKLPMDTKVWFSQEGIQHLAAASGNPDMLLICADEFKLDMNAGAFRGRSVQHCAASHHNPAQLLMCALLNLDLNKQDGTGSNILGVTRYTSQIANLLTCQLLELSVQREAENGYDLSIPNTLLTRLLYDYPMSFIPKEEKPWQNQSENTLSAQVIKVLQNFIDQCPTTDSRLFNRKEKTPSALAKQLISYVKDFANKPAYELFFFLNYYLIDLLQAQKVEFDHPLTGYIRFATNQVLQSIFAKRAEAKLENDEQPAMKQRKLV